MLVRRTCLVALVLASFAACESTTVTPDEDSALPSSDSGVMDSGTPPSGCVVDDDCDDGVYCNGAERCMPRATDADGRGCVDALAGPCAEGETCDEETSTCDAGCADVDRDGHRDAACGGDDCDDADANRYPGNVETCDMAAHDEDCNTDTFGFLDSDGDGSGSYVCCNVLAGGDLACGDDCNDSDSTVNTRAGDGPPLYCDGIDNDCSGTADEGCPCVEGETQECGSEAQRMRIGICRPGTQVCSGGEFTAACIGAIAPAEEICDELDDDCDGTVDEAVRRTYYPDVDGDGYGETGGTPVSACSAPAGHASNATDCDDTVASVNPGATEVCNGIDDNCLAGVDEGFVGTFYRDDDRDGFGDAATSTTGCSPPAGYVRNPDDCDDTRAIANPAAAEICNGLDDNCAGGIDEGVLRTFYLDGDHDGAGGTTTATGCTAPAGYVVVGGDCADGDAARYPGRYDACNGVDDDCNGTVDPGCTCTDGARRDCGVGPGGGPPTNVGECAIGSQLCVGGTWGSCVGDIGPSTETCDGLDQDCDGTVDDGTTVDTCLADGDRDGYGAGAVTRQCRDVSRASDGYCPPGWTTSSGDCNDASPSVRPMAVEVCNGIDDNCSGTIDEGVTATGCYADADGDTYGIGSATTQCRDAARAAQGYCPVGYTNRGGDCNDFSSAVHPGASEACNGRDDDCSGTADDGSGMICVAGTSRTGTGATAFCASVPGTYTCVSCTSESFTPSPPAETCNGLDDDCDGAPDDAYVCVRGSTGHACVTSCGTAGTRSCSTSCSFTGQACTGAEVCNGCDDDGDAVADDGFACVAGTTRSCTRSCGATALGGTQRCLADCSGWSACTLTEQCNGCDDDGDGSVDNGFTCPQNQITYCTTACGTAGQQICNTSCSGYTSASCLAIAETCNFCDDDGDGTSADDVTASGPVTHESDVCTSWTFGGAATCSGTAATLVDAVSETGAIWAPARYMGWGRVVFQIGIVRAQAPAAGEPGQGFGILMTNDPPGALTGTATPSWCGLPARRGMYVTWEFTPGGAVADVVAAGQMSTTVRTQATSATVPASFRFDAASGSQWFTLEVVYEGTPSAGTRGNVEVTVIDGAGIRTPLLAGDLGGGADILNVGDPIWVGFTAATTATQDARIDTFLTPISFFGSDIYATNLVVEDTCSTRSP